jgi:hypothetical protein
MAVGGQIWEHRQNRRCGEKMELRVLGSDSALCRELVRQARRALRRADVAAPLRRVESLSEISSSPVLRLPALLIDNTIVAAGFVPSAVVIEGMLRAHLRSGEV